MTKAWHSLGMLLFLVLLCLAVGQLGTFFTTDDALTWYEGLAKPGWTPPAFLFPIVWTALYVLMALAAWLVWRRKQPGYQHALVWWTVQLVLNALWTPLFFGQQQVLYGLAVIDMLWLVLLITIIFFYRHSRLAAFLLLIYLAWISFAGVLNFMFWRLNS